MAINPLTLEQMAQVQEFLKQAPQKKKKKTAQVAPMPEVEIESPFLRGVVEGVEQTAESIASRPSDALIAALQATGQQPAQVPSPEFTPPSVAGPEETTPRQQALGMLASAGNAIPTRTNAELEALRDFQAAQSGAQRGEALLPFVMAAQRVNEAWTGAPVDVQTLGAVQKQLRGKETDAAQRLQAAIEFARRQQQGEQFQQTMAQRAGESQADFESRMAQTQAQAGLRAQELGIEERKLALAEEMARQRAQKSPAAPGGRGVRPVDELTQKRRELEVKKLEAELAAMQSGQPTTKQQMEALQLQQLQQRVTGQDPTKVKMAEAAAQRIKALISDLRGLFKQHGPEVFGPTALKMRQISEAITVEAKNIAELGALQGFDKDILENIKGTDPTDYFANTFGTGDTLQSLDFMDRWVDNTVKAAKEIYGPPRQKKPGVPGFPFVVVDKQTGREFTVKNQAELESIRPYADRLQLKGGQ